MNIVEERGIGARSIYTLYRDVCDCRISARKINGLSLTQFIEMIGDFSDGSR